MLRRFIAVLVLAAVCSMSWPVAAAFPSSVLAAAVANHHSCCLGGHHGVAVPFGVPTVPFVPCEHPCCAKSAPENPASLPATTRVTRPELEIVATAVTDSSRRFGRVALAATEAAFFPSFVVRSTVLRS